MRTALVSVWDKSGIVRLAKRLAEHGVSLIATGGTLSALRSANLAVRSVDEVGRFPEMLEGRVKTLQPEIFAGILARKSSDEHMKQISAKGIEPIDMVVCNFYPFEATEAGKDSSLEKTMEMIDIGGPSIVRASAKNYESVCVVPSPSLYNVVLDEMDRLEGRTTLELRKKLALSAFEAVASYDAAIYNALWRRLSGAGLFPDSFFLAGKKYDTPKYGENPDQQAMLYAVNGNYGGIPSWVQRYGDTRSYNNFLDIGSAYEILEGFECSPAAATVKHGHISGFAFSDSLEDAYRLAHACDPEADFGNTTVLNRVVDSETAALIGRAEGENAKTKDPAPVYTEIVIAPGYSEGAIEILKNKQKKKIRIIEAREASSYPFDLKLKEGLLLVQQKVDYKKKLDASRVTIESKERPTSEDKEIMLGLWEVVRRVESNGIVLGSGRVSKGKLEKLWTIGVGSFRKRNGATKIALDNAGVRATGSFCASDGFFPFPDSIEMLGQARVRGVIQPGGSLKDPEVIKKADEYSMQMLFTHTRAFKH